MNRLNIIVNNTCLWGEVQPLHERTRTQKHCTEERPYGIVGALEVEEENVVRLRNHIVDEEEDKIVDKAPPQLSYEASYEDPSAVIDQESLSIVCHRTVLV